MFFTERKLGSRIKELEPYRYRDSRPLTALKFQLDPEGHVAAPPPAGGEWEACSLGQRWKGWDLYIWLRTEAPVPVEWQDRRVVGRFDFGRTGPGHTRGFESLLFVNGRPYQGVDSNHREVFFDASAAGSTLQLDFRLWSGLCGGGRPQEMIIELQQAEICWLDETVDDFFYSAAAVWETVELLSENQPERADLLQALDRAFLEIDWTRPGSDDFYASVGRASERLQEQLALIENHNPVTVTCIGHTHIDVAWLWRLKHTREKCARSFSTVLRLMELFPDYKFLQSQPQLYQYIKEDYPEIYAEIKERVASGEWEADGGMWVEADCNLSSGEALVRQILVGTKFLQEEFGVRSSYLWLPDVFGYSWALPQILKKSGIDTFMTTKISWNQYNHLPHDTFKWRGIDGTEILTHFITTPTPGGARFYTYNGETRAPFIKGIWDNYRDKALNKELLLAYGYGDGGGGVTRDMLEMRRRLADMPGMPKAQTGRADEYFARLHETIDSADQYVHTWDGELYLEYHRGTYTSQALNKWYNRKLELALRETEWLRVLQAASGKSWHTYPAAELLKSWQTVLLHQFHDIIPGSSIREVYEDSLEDYRAVDQVLTASRAEAIEELTSKTEPTGYTVFNNGSWEMGGLVEIPAAENMQSGSWHDTAGSVLPAARSGSRWVVYVPKVPSLGYTTVFFSADMPMENPSAFTLEESGVETPFYRLTWDDAGQLTELYDKDTQRSVLAPRAKGNVLQIFEDKPMAHDAWDIDIYYQQKCQEITRLVSTEVLEQNELRCVIRFHWEFDQSKFVQDMTLYSRSRRIDFETYVNWRQRQQLLKVAFPVDVRAVEASFDIQFGSVKRATHWNTSWDWARFETVGHHWADLSEPGFGVSLLNDCKYGYDVKDNVMRLSLLKGAIHPDYQADLGEHRFTYALLPHGGSWAENTPQEAWQLNQPLQAVPGQPETALFTTFAAEGHPVQFDAVKKAEANDAIVLRVHEYLGGRGTVKLRTDLPIQSWQEVNLLEDAVGDVESGPLEFSLKPFEIKTLRMELSS